MKKIKLYDYVSKLGLDHRGQYIAAAYADCLPDYVDIDGHDGCYGAGRMLNFLLPDPIKVKDLQPYLVLIGEYNGFNPDSARDLVLELFGQDALVFVAREGSPCLYVRPHNYVDLKKIKDLHDFAVDELAYCEKLNMFRLWWD